MLKKLSFLTLIVTLTSCAYQPHSYDDGGFKLKGESKVYKTSDANQKATTTAATTPQKKVVHNNSSKDAYYD